MAGLSSHFCTEESEEEEEESDDEAQTFEAPVNEEVGDDDDEKHGLERGFSKPDSGLLFFCTIL